MNTRNTGKTAARRTFLALSAATAALSLSACGVIDGVGSDDASATPKKGNDITVGLLLPEKENQRYEKFDYPIIKDQVGVLTKHQGKVVYANALQDAERQSAQMEGMIHDKVDVILLDAVDAKSIEPAVRKAKDAGIPVIAYDRLARGPIDAYISFDNELVGQVQGRAVVEALGTKAGTSKIVMMNGSKTDPNAGQFKEGALSELENKVNIVKSFDTVDWKPENAKRNMSQAISEVGLDNIAAVYSANDGMAGAVIDALKEAGAGKIPPVTGQDADLSAVQRIIAGQQYMSVYKPYPEEATNAAEMAVARVQGRSIEFDALTRDSVDSPTHQKIPAMLVQVVALTKDNIQETVLKDSIYTVKELCTAKYKASCDHLGLE
ncbi:MULTISPECIES: sugar ABC transporter substrate-binding protein [Streptomyces]|uniref:Substrate-binding domain-containing protein n=1 Tax=Streptomyces griseoaurantiacus TaxID=68213 RepID=A0A7W2DR93_9ACTN|nr:MULTISPECIES: substrate-binding domain-containing protein [Streptomyces]MBA5221538.1 substrate-binding domain-containing protein [Streptomyces griseoaurantiacus]MCF0090578.1 D-xylose-binding periplasmic protein [Streptomyces sp. MH192]MCF0100536.1 D-xylose-binding periplasmic protein [Streptomyces sp. MH191]MDX3087781.1 substrate-binding domain-containing protein [Streptomyces sp. ME12-02E]MDX3331039.1 substrate-binding domain-containing protein [Streptomyces sp. ME02-6978a]